MNEDKEGCEGDCEECFNYSYCKHYKEEQKIKNSLQDKIIDYNKLNRLEKRDNF